MYLSERILNFFYLNHVKKKKHFNQWTKIDSMKIVTSIKNSRFKVQNSHFGNRQEINQMQSWCLCCVMTHQANSFRSQSTSLLTKTSNKFKWVHTSQSTNKKKNEKNIWFAVCAPYFIWFACLLCVLRLNTFRLTLGHAPARSAQFHHHDGSEYAKKENTRHKSHKIQCSPNHMLPIHWFGNNLITRWWEIKMKPIHIATEWTERATESSGNETKIRECRTLKVAAWSIDVWANCQYS